MKKFTQVNIVYKKDDNQDDDTIREISCKFYKSLENTETLGDSRKSKKHQKNSKLPVLNLF